jgi:hypothetical protein
MLAILVIVHAGISTNLVCHCKAILTLSNSCLLPLKLKRPLHFPFESRKSSKQGFWYDEGIPDIEISDRFSAQYGNSVLPD